MYSLNNYHGGQSVIVVKLILGEIKCVKAFILKKFDRNPATQKASSNSSYPACNMYRNNTDTFLLIFFK